MKLLLVEDEAINVMFVKSLVKNFSKSVEFLHARTGKEAICLAEEHKPGLILMDVGLPDTSGLEVTKTLRQQPAQKETVIIGLTALSQPSDQRDCLEAGMTDVFPKPFNKHGFHNLLTKYL